jgi:hypothetical protein
MISRSTLDSYANHVRRMITNGERFGLKQGDLLSAPATMQLIRHSELDQRNGRACSCGLSKFLKFLNRCTQAPVLHHTQQIKLAAAKPHAAEKPENIGEPWVCSGLTTATPDMELSKLGKFERRRKGSVRA